MQKELGLFTLKRGGKGGDFLLSSVSWWEVLGRFKFHVAYFCIPGFKAIFFYFFWKPANKQTNKQKSL